MRSFVALLVISSFTYLALSQTTCGTAPTGCASCAPSTASLTANFCTSCNTGFLLTGAQSTCATALSAGCAAGQNATTCTTCMSGYVLASGACISCTATATGGSAGCITCTAASGNTTCTACATGYALSGSYCFPCNATTATTFGTTSLIGRANCVACNSTVTTQVSGAGSITGSYLTCTACASGYTIIPSNVNALVSTPVCVNHTAGSVAQTTGTDGNGASGTLAAEALLAAASGLTNCATAAITAPGTSGGNPFTYATTGPCATSTAGYYCGYLVGATPTFNCLTTITAGNLASGVTVPTNCNGGVYAGDNAATSITAVTCQFCATGYQLISGACVQILTNCVSMATATTCAVPASGYALSSASLPVACSASTTTPCAGGAPSGTFLASNGSYLTGTAITNCWYHNSTSFCVQCAPGYASPAPNCTACPANCNNCSSATTCTGCASTYTLATNGTCSKSNCTNVSANGTCLYSKNLIASGLAFVSMVFYYLF